MAVLDCSPVNSSCALCDIHNTCAHLHTCRCVRKGRRVVAELFPLLASAVNPHTESHKDYPACTANPCDESRLLHYICDLLRKTDVLVGFATSTCDCGLLCGQFWRERERNADQRVTFKLNVLIPSNVLERIRNFSLIAAVQKKI